MTRHSRPNWSPDLPEVPETKPLSSEEFKFLPSTNPHQAFILSEQTRPGFIPFMQELEYTHYVPDTDRNALFELIFTKWHGLVWLTLIIPLEDLPKAEELAKKYEFRFVRGATAMIITDGTQEWFPMEQKENVLSVSGFIKDRSVVKKLEEEMSMVISAHAEKVTNDVGA